ncbi:MAG: LPS export ABC transporter periplasmic protein LptC [Gammaproteobacteria bacterium]
MWAVLLILLLLAGLTQWLLNLNDARSPPVRNTHDPDYTMENFTITSMGSTGKPQQRLQSTYMAHYPDDDSSEFTKPHITVFREEDAPWEIYGERGWVSGGREHILLRGDALIENPQAPAERRLRMVTQDLHVFADEEYVETDRPVTITSQTSVTHSTGLRAQLKEGRVQLLSKVRGTYAPKSNAATR